MDPSKTSSLNHRLLTGAECVCVCVYKKERQTDRHKGEGETQTERVGRKEKKL